MAWYRAGGGGIPSSLKTGMNSVLNKKFGTSTTYDPAGWPDDVNLMGPLPEKTIVSSPIADFSDGADDVPTKSLVVTIPPTLSGVSSVSVTQTGKNLLVNNIEDGATGGITYTKNSDGSISCSGTVSNVNSTRLICTQVLPIGSYILSGADSSINLRAVLYDSNGSVITNRNDTGSGVTISVDSTVSYIEIRIKARTNAEQVSTTISPMLAVGSTVQTYEKYNGTQYTASLGRTIYGGTVDIVNGEGEDTHGLITDFSTIRANGTSTSGAYRYIMDVSGMGDYNVGACVSNFLNYRVSWNADAGEFYNTANVLVIFLSQDNVSDAINYLSSNACKVAYPFATPTDFTFDKVPIDSKLGNNTLWSDEGDTEVTYRADIDLLLGGN